MSDDDPAAVLRFAVRSAERFTELVSLDAPEYLLHSECATLVGLLAKVMRRCVAAQAPAAAKPAAAPWQCTCHAPPRPGLCPVHEA